MTPEECLVQYGKAWFTRDRAERIEVLRECCTEDIVFVDSGERWDGLEAVADMIGRGMDGMSGSQSGGGTTEIAEQDRGMSGSGVGVRVVTPIEAAHGFFRYSFVWTLPDGSEHGGTDFCQVADDGRMSVITVWPANRFFPLPAPRA